MNKIWEGFKVGFMRFLSSTFYVWIAAIIGFISGWIFGTNAGIFTFFGFILAVIAFVFLRQGWWFVSGTGDYTGREGFLLKLYKKVFKK
jgi:hypothetical protein